MAELKPDLAIILADIPLDDPDEIPPDGDDTEADGWPPIVSTAAPAAPSGPGGQRSKEFKLTPAQRIGSRDRAMRAAALALQNRANVHYTQGPKRWEGIANKLRAAKGQYPKNADCSSFATWCLWNGLLQYSNAPDVVNGAGWAAGYTGTQLSNGVRVTGEIMRGDLALYGSGHPGKHVAICIGDGLVISHGSENGPYKLKLRYRSDLMEVRRYIR